MSSSLGFGAPIIRTTGSPLGASTTASGPPPTAPTAPTATAPNKDSLGIENALKHEKFIEFTILGNGRVQVKNTSTGDVVLTVDKNNIPTKNDWELCKAATSDPTGNTCASIYKNTDEYAAVDTIVNKINSDYFKPVDYTPTGIKNSYNLLKAFRWYKKSSTEVVDVQTWHDERKKLEPNKWDNIFTTTTHGSGYKPLLEQAVNIVNFHPEVFTGSNTNRSSRQAVNNRGRNTIFHSSIGSNIGLRAPLGAYGRVYNQRGTMLPFLLQGGQDLVPNELRGGAYPDFEGDHPIVNQLKNQVKVFEQYMRGNGKTLATQTQTDYKTTSDNLNAALKEADKLYYNITKARLIPFDKNAYSDEVKTDEVEDAVKKYIDVSKTANKNLHKFRVFINGLASTIAIQNLNSQNNTSSIASQLQELKMQKFALEDHKNNTFGLSTDQQNAIDEEIKKIDEQLNKLFPTSSGTPSTAPQFQPI